jgi:hypothetical protein
VVSKGNGIEFNGLGEVRDGTLEIPSRKAGKAAVEVTSRVARTKQEIKKAHDGDSCRAFCSGVAPSWSGFTQL